jgi:hypothetical protein
MRRTLLRGGMGLIAVALTVPAFAEDFAARLGRVPVDSRTQGSIAGIGQVSAELDGNKLKIEGDFSGMLGPATVANLHEGVAVAARGPAIHELTVSKLTAGELSGEVELDRAQIAALRAGRLYVQVHSEIAPDGNLWGWLLVE